MGRNRFRTSREDVRSRKLDAAMVEIPLCRIKAYNHSNLLEMRVRGLDLPAFLFAEGSLSPCTSAQQSPSVCVCVCVCVFVFACGVPVVTSLDSWTGICRGQAPSQLLQRRLVQAPQALPARRSTPQRYCPLLNTHAPSHTY